MIVKLTSSNPNFLSLIKKNKESFFGTQLRELKNGVAIGRIISDNEYHIVFQDTKYSFSEDTSNMIDFQSYCNPRVFLNLSSLYLRDFFSKKSEWNSIKIPWLNDIQENIDTKGYTHSLTIENIYADLPNRKFVLSKYFPEIKLEKKIGSVYSLSIETDKSLHYLFNLAALTAIYLTATNRQNFFINKEMTIKYIKVLSNLDPIPYFVIYLFAKSCISGKEDFIILKNELESLFNGTLLLCGMSTQEMRLHSIKDLIVKDDLINSDIIEIGCGEMDYPRFLLGKIDSNHTWYCNDKEDFSIHLNNIKYKFKDKNIIFTKDLTSIEAKDATVLLVEVIEHMKIEEGKNLLRYIFTLFAPKKVIITTPNISFNKYFGFDDNQIYRHDDHKFELTSNEFKEYIDLVCPENYSVKYFGIGDKVNDEFMTLGAEIEKTS